MKTAQELQVEFLNMRLLQSENQRVILCRKLENSVSKETYEAAVADRNMYKAERDHERKLRENAELKNEELEKEIIGYKCKIAALESEKAEFKDLADLMRKEDLDNKSVADMLKGLLYARSSAISPWDEGIGCTSEAITLHATSLSCIRSWRVASSIK